MARDLPRFSRLASRACAALAMGVGLTAFTGWVVDSPQLRAVFAGDIEIKTNTAISLFALGTSLLFTTGWQTGHRVVAVIFAWIPITLGSLTLSEHLIGWDLGIDQLIFQERVGAAATASPNRMGPPASICSPLLGLALLAIDRRTPKAATPAQWLALAAMVVALIPILGYILNVRPLYGTARLTGIALHTALAFVIVAVGTLASRPEAGIMRRLLADDAGGLVLRRLIPAAIAMPIILGRLRVIGQDAGLYDAEFGRTLLVFCFILLFSGLTWWTSGVVQRHAAARARAEAAERKMHAGLQVSLESERHARATAERSNRTKDEFLAMLGHELRTPLNAIVGWTSLLLSGGLPDRDRQTGLEAIQRNSRLQVQLIEDLLDVSRFDAGKVELDVQEVDLTLVIESAIAALAPQVRAAGLTLERRLEVGVTVAGDPARLQQVLANLLSNALKFTPSGGTIAVSLSRVPGQAIISVSDTGIGISEEFLPRVFDRFGQADVSTTRRHGGLGLGLTIARQLTELHGGTLTAESAGMGRGATFTVRLPLVGSTAHVTSEHTGAEDRLPPAAALTGVRVLLVDDHHDAIDLFAHALRRSGAAVTTAQNVDDAIDTLGSHAFDVLVTDIGMPGKDGYDLIRYVRASQPGLAAIALTALARAEDANRAIAAGFTRHLAKPTSPHALVSAVVAVTEQARGVIDPSRVV